MSGNAPFSLVPAPADPAGAARWPADPGAEAGGTGYSAALQVAFPFRVNPHGRVATVGWEQHVEEMIEQVLFTAPGERVNRPDFGCGVQLLVFAPENTALVAATQFLIQGSLTRWLGDVITLEAVTVSPSDSTLEITVAYRLRESGLARTATYRRAGTP